MSAAGAVERAPADKDPEVGGPGAYAVQACGVAFPAGSLHRHRDRGRRRDPTDRRHPNSQNPRIGTFVKNLGRHLRGDHQHPVPQRRSAA